MTHSVDGLILIQEAYRMSRELRVDFAALDATALVPNVRPSARTLLCFCGSNLPSYFHNA
jgi:hypothetical protein